MESVIFKFQEVQLVSASSRQFFLVSESSLKLALSTHGGNVPRESGLFLGLADAILSCLSSHILYRIECLNLRGSDTQQ